jgi:hypothetical protein
MPILNPLPRPGEGSRAQRSEHRQGEDLIQPLEKVSDEVPNGRRISRVRWAAEPAPTLPR